MAEPMKRSEELERALPLALRRAVEGRSRLQRRYLLALVLGSRAAQQNKENRMGRRGLLSSSRIPGGR